jgi:hypothetical protein
MKRNVSVVLMGLVAYAIGGNEAGGRGFGGFRGGGFSSSFSGSRSASFGGSRSGGGGFDSFGGSRSSSFSASRSENYGGWGHSGSASGSRSGGFAAGGGRAAGGSSYDRSYTGSRGGSYSASGERGFAAGPGGAAAGSSRDVTATGAGGRSYSSSSDHGYAAGRYGGSVSGGERSTTATGVNGRSYAGSSEHGYAVGPYGRAVGGSRGSATASGARGTASASWQSAFAGGGHMSTDFGLAHYSSVGAASVGRVGHSTAYWSHSYVTGHAAVIRGNFGYSAAFRPAWYTAHPGCWAAAGWGAGAAWTAATWPAVTTWCSIPAPPINYDYGNTLVINDNSVTLNGQPAGTAPEFAAQATAIADKGQQAGPPPDAEWKPLGVFSLTQGYEQQSNYVFQFAVSKEGVIRGNYYDGLMDATTPVYGSVDPKSQRAAWTIGKKNDRVFEAGISNLTGEQCPVLIHIGKDKTQQWMLVRQEPATEGK